MEPLSHRHPSLSLVQGCRVYIFEMACGRPMFPGSTVEEQLMLIWKVRPINVTPSLPPPLPPPLPPSPLPPSLPPCPFFFLPRCLCRHWVRPRRVRGQESLKTRSSCREDTTSMQRNLSHNMYQGLFGETFLCYIAYYNIVYGLVQ